MTPLVRFQLLRPLVGLLFVSLAACASAQSWQHYATPEEAGFASAELDAARQYADSIGSAAVMVIYRGQVLVAWGDIERKFWLHSVRKSLVSALYGIAVEKGEIDLDATLADLGIDDINPLTAQEQQARVRDLIAARSGVFLPAAYAPEDQDRNRPERGHYAPGAHWFYNNWDFNLAGVIYEQETGTDLYEAFAEQIAAPLGMEDFEPSDGFRVVEPSRSQHPAHTFRMSARDLARFGQLFLQEGHWQGRQVITADWIHESTRPVTDFGEGAGYGYMWWTNSAGSHGDRYPHLNQYDTYMGRGTGGQRVLVIPSLDLVYVHRADTDLGDGVRGSLRVIDRILGAWGLEAANHPALKSLAATPFTDRLLPPAPPTYLDIEASAMSDYIGAYALAPGVMARVFVFEERLFMSIPGEGEAELFRLAEDEFTVRVIAGVHIAFERGEGGEVSGVRVALGERQLHAPRL